MQSISISTVICCRLVAFVPSAAPDFQWNPLKCCTHTSKLTCASELSEKYLDNQHLHQSSRCPLAHIHTQHNPQSCSSPSFASVFLPSLAYHIRRTQDCQYGTNNFILAPEKKSNSHLTIHRLDTQLR